MRKISQMLVFLLMLQPLLLAQTKTSTTIATLSKAGTRNSFITVSAPVIFQQRDALHKTSTLRFDITYDVNCTPEIKGAFEYATQIWGLFLNSNAPIKIKVEYLPLERTTLGSTITSFCNNFTNAPFTDIQYPLSLAKKFDNNLVNSLTEEYDFTVQFNSQIAWSFETNGIPVQNTHDFVSVALHEIAHGLGICESVKENMNNRGTGIFGQTGFNNNPAGKYPTIYDKFLKTTDYLINRPQESIQLFKDITSGNLYFEGVKAKAANKGNSPKLYAPSSWVDGSSVSHLDPDKLEESKSTANYLMRPYTDMAEVIHNPGEIILGVLQDIGWSVNRYISVQNIREDEALLKNSNFTISWFDTKPTSTGSSSTNDIVSIMLYKVHPLYPQDDLLIRTIYQERLTQSNGSYTWKVDGTLDPEYHYYLRFVNDGNIIGQTEKFTVTDKPAAPRFNIPSGIYASSQPIEITSNVEGGIIRYTLDGTTPLESSPEYVAPVIIENGDIIVSARVFVTLSTGSVIASDVSQSRYTISSTAKEISLGTQAVTYSMAMYPGNSFPAYGDESGMIEIGGITNVAKNGTTITVSRAKIQLKGLTNIPRGAIIKNAYLIIPFTKRGDTEIQFYYNSSYNTYEYNVLWTQLSGGTNLGSATVGEINNEVQGSYTYPVVNLPAKIQTAVDEGTESFDISVVNTNESDELQKLTYYGNPVLKVVYELNVIIKQEDSKGNSYDAIGIFESNRWAMHPVPYSCSWPLNTDIIVKSTSGLKPGVNEKFSYWSGASSYYSINNVIKYRINSRSTTLTSVLEPSKGNIKIRNLYEGSELINPSNDRIYFKDPWLVDMYSGTYLTNINQGASAPFKERTSPFIPGYSELYGNDIHKGVFLNKKGNFAYAAQAEPVQMVEYPAGSAARSCSFFNWTSNGTDPLMPRNLLNGRYETPIVFLSDGATVNANYKVTHLSNNRQAYKNNGQKKLVSTEQGGLYSVYESMGSVWLEADHATDSWEIVNGGQSLDGGMGAKSPSVARYSDENANEYVLVTYQKKTASGSYQIMLDIFNSAGGSRVAQHTVYESLNAFTNDATPLVSTCYGFSSADQMNRGRKIMLVWKEAPQGQKAGGLYHRGGVLFRDNSIEWYDLSTNPLTAPEAQNPSFEAAEVVHGDYGDNLEMPVFHLVWEQNRKIYYKPIYYSAERINPGAQQEISSGSGFAYHRNPSITVTNDDDPFAETDYNDNDFVKVVWLAGDDPSLDDAAVFRARTDNNHYTGSGGLYAFGAFSSHREIDGFTSVNINRSSEGRFAYTYSAPGTEVRIIKGNNPGFTSLALAGKYDGQAVQLSNGLNESPDVHVQLFENSALPCSFARYASQFPVQGMLKSSSDGQIIASGRTSVVSLDSTVDFYYELGGLKLDGQTVGFGSIPEGIAVNTREKMESYASGNPFTAGSDNSVLSFRLRYGMTDSLLAQSLMNEREYVRFRLELIDDQSGKVIDVLQRSEQKKGSLNKMRMQPYSLKLQGLAGRKLRLRIVSEDNLEKVSYSMLSVEEGKGISRLDKNDAIDLSLNTEGAVKEYAMEQNYPNPFNPTTTINYQIPRAGFVRLKVYDVLGREVAELVNAFKSQGRYTAEFNAAGLSSGTYIYELRVNDYKSVRKMMLVK